MHLKQTRPLPLLWPHQLELQHSRCGPESCHSCPSHHSRSHHPLDLRWTTDKKKQQLVIQTCSDSLSDPLIFLTLKFQQNQNQAQTETILIVKVNNIPAGQCHQTAQSECGPSSPALWPPDWLSPLAPHTAGLCSCTLQDWKTQINKSWKSL